MPIAVQFDQPVAGPLRRAHIYGGAINVTSPTAAATSLVLFARTLISEAFGGRDPELAQFDLPGPEYAAIVEALEPRFRYHPDTRRLVQQLLVERGCDPETTYFDAPRLRISTSDDYLATGLALTCQPHRDTWYSAPLAQLNYWMPVYDVSEDNALALHPEYFNQAIANGSEEYDHLVWHAQDSGDARTLPGPTETVNPFSATVLITPVGGMLQFSGHHLQSNVPNDSGRTRFSIDFRTVDIDDIRAGLGARNVDGRCTGSTIRQFVSAAALAPVPDDVAALFDGVGETTGHVADVPPTQPVSTS
ncbi:hypothetical protein TUM20985_14160 [Mycobacterium antarcticum]|uniref:hypothetical protein n=1 Tax=Mycolicibacterium sp. TUM20985 TaxID=3023370 RepID=UPI0025727199|nr:hypothetical protein [Mycolicibacterium sp. TUM20985]BDX30869.1 hypothetical protein TUM20985_14160 [Mycolicibacterium sp. TUM20985]